MTAGLAALRALVHAPRPAAAPVCELCAEPLADRHDHILTLATGGIECACTACALLFDPGLAKRRLPRDARYLPGFDLAPQEWAALDIPVKLAFLGVRRGQALATYPSPGGLVTHPVDLNLWQTLLTRHPELAGLQDDLETLLLNYLASPHQLFRVPLDHAFRLAGLIRSAWTGMTGGPLVRQHIQAFCTELGGDAPAQHPNRTPAHA